jgi:hypothetical protein
VAAKAGTPPPAVGDPELQMAKSPIPAPQAVRLPEKFPEQPWKKKIDS